MGQRGLEYVQQFAIVTGRFSQFSQNELGLYMAANKDWKYIYSAADHKEWLFDLANDPLEIENLIDEPDCADQVALLKNACIQRFQIDGYTACGTGNTLNHLFEIIGIRA